MIAVAGRTAIDARIDETLDRIRMRAEPLGDGFGALAGAAGRAGRGGKRLRPALVAASFDAFGGDPDNAPALYDIAAAFELLHTAFVVHDDLIDHDFERRGVPNVAGEFRARGRECGMDAAGAALLGNAAGLFAGDLLLHEASRLVALADLDSRSRARLHALFDDAVYVSAAGELADVEHSVSASLADPAQIIDATFRKTAVYSFRAPLAAGAVLAAAPDAARTAIEAAGDRLGLAFQLVDDLIGAFGSAAQAGRESGGDLREAKQTPLIAFAHDSAAWASVSRALALARTRPTAVREAQRALEASGARARLRALVDETLAGVRFASADPVLPAEAGALLRELADRIGERAP